MRIGVPTEIKTDEYRVGMTPAGVAVLHNDGHEVFVQSGAGNGSGFSDEEYKAAGAKIVPDADAVFEKAEMIVKVKEPIAADLKRLREGQLLFTYLHLAPVPDLTQALLKKKITGVAYETITDERKRTLPLLTPMSEVAGRMSVHVGAYYLHKPNGGRGILPGGVPGVLPGDVVIIGGGVVGTNAAKMATGLGARVTILDTNLERLRQIDDIFRGTVQTLASNIAHIAEAARHADLLIGGVQIPGAVPRTSTIALTNATLPYIRRVASLGFSRAIEDPGLAEGVNVYKGSITYKAVAESQSRSYTPLAQLT